MEAATGKDFSKAVDIPQPDGMMERAVQFVKWLAKENPRGRWDYFLSEDRQGLRGERVIMAGAFTRLDHGGTVCQVSACGSSRDVLRTTRPVRDVAGVAIRHACEPVLRLQPRTRRRLDGAPLRSFLGIAESNKFGPIVNVDHATPPFGNTRRLVTAADVKNDPLLRL